MYQFKRLKIVALAFSVALLAACGGGSSTSPTAATETAKPIPEPEWASPAMFVKLGETKKIIALPNGSCARYNNSLEEDSEPLQNVSVTIYSNGDLSFSSSLDVSTTASVNIFVTASAATYSRIAANIANGTLTSATIYSEYSVPNDESDSQHVSLTAYRYMGEGGQLVREFYASTRYMDGETEYYVECSGSDVELALERLPSDNRILQKFVPTGNQDKVSFDIEDTLDGDIDDGPYRYLTLDQSTGKLNLSDVAPSLPNAKTLTVSTLVSDYFAKPSSSFYYSETHRRAYDQSNTLTSSQKELEFELDIPSEGDVEGVEIEDVELCNTNGIVGSCDNFYPDR